METIVPAGTVTPLENVNGRYARRTEGTGENGLVSRTSIWGAEKRVQRTGDETKPKVLPNEAVYLVHLVHPGFCLAFFFNHSIYLFSQGCQIFGVSKEAA
jgi:hypothetical protein